ncbi:hypothetical protein BJF77_12045 [Kocuria sp. CNJ-770]|uniref:hypothetical protein n=1 Tax=Kocuria sp. CNJ-770 TaxID=1904964 RepID=UPI000964486C|nr:hypothetical protein [Kocuria sp. CNJ-770]OLT08690.1 hypothetical protein BJF77_12045 [Kocuria sp. CNJ-770]
MEVPEWVVRFDPKVWPGVGEWSEAVHAWAKEHLFERRHFGAWIEVIGNTYTVTSQQRRTVVVATRA